MDTASVVRVLIVDDHPMVREGLRSMLDAEGVEVVGEAGTAADAVRMSENVNPDVVLLDVGLPDADGLAALAGIRAGAPKASILVVTMHDEPRLVRRAIEGGAAGYVLKGVGRRELLAAVRAVRDGESVVDRALLRDLVADTPAGRQTASSQAAPLTRVEHDVLRLVAQGLTNREISLRMRWSVATAKKYVQRILEKLGVSDRTQAAVEAARAGLLD
jgi:DNA-binding NarL/FixJ family response regulator